MQKKKIGPQTARYDYWTYPDMNKVVETALYYGFTPLEAVAIEKQDKEHARALSAGLDADFSFSLEERVALIRANFSKPNSNPPIMAISRRGNSGRRTGDGRRDEFAFDIIGTSRSIADATIVKTICEAARNEGYEDLCVEVNSVGDRESFARFTRDFIAYYRKYLGDIHPDCRQAFKKNPFHVLACSHEKCLAVRDEAPQSICYLSEPSRQHFKEFLEFLEITGISYAINNSLVRNTEIASHTIFSVFGHEPKKDLERLAYGMRWTGLAKKMGLRKDVPGATAVVSLKKCEEKKAKKIRKPLFYFIQMGQEAKLKSLNLIESLRQSKIPLYHSLTKDKLTSQLVSAEYLRVPYILIMGQKESMDNTVLIREMMTRSQDTVRIDRVADYLKKLAP